jgi:hypothetical protein
MSRISADFLRGLQNGSPEFKRLNKGLFEQREADAQRLTGILDSAAEKVAEAKSEKQLQGQLEGLLRRRGVQCPIRPRTDRKSTINEGAPDIMFSLPGVGAIAWEVKMPGQHPRPEQLKCHEQMRADGWRVFVVRSYAEGLAILDALERKEAA